jgi:hypothetical protein
VLIRKETDYFEVFRVNQQGPISRSFPLKQSHLELLIMQQKEERKQKEHNVL